MMRQRLSLLLFLTLALSLANGCVDDLETRDTDIAIACSDDSDCEGQICQAQRCVDPSDQEIAIAIQADFDSVTRQYADLVFVPGQAMPDLPPPSLVEVWVEVTRRNDTIPATVGFRASRSIPGTAIESWSEVGAEGSPFELIPGDYQVTVHPSSASGLPSRVFYNVAISDEDSNLSLQLVDTSQGERLVIYPGFLKLSFLSSGEERPAEFVKVTAKSDDGLYESQPVVVCEELDAEGGELCDGSFELTLPAQKPGEERYYHLEIEATSQSVEIPKIKLESFVVSDALAEQMVGSDAFRLPKKTHVAKAIPDFVTLKGKVISANDRSPVAGAFISAQGTFGESASFRTWATIDQPDASPGLPTESDGVFVLRVPDTLVSELNPYTINIEVQKDSPYASSSSSISDDLKGEIILELPQKPTIRGQLYGRNLSQPIAQANIQAFPIDNEELSPDYISTRSDDSGAFFITVEPGSYVLYFAPLVSSGQPNHVLQLEVEQDIQLEPIVLGPTSVVFGRVLEYDAIESSLLVPAPGVKVEIFAEDQEQPFPIGSGVTDDEGIYRVIVATEPDE